MAKKITSITVNINPKVYPLDVIYTAAYVLLDKYYILLDGDPKKNIKVILTPKENNANLEKAKAEFHNELINYAFYKEQSKKNSALRQIMLQAALLSAEKTAEPAAQANEAIATDAGLPLKVKDADFLKDPEGIAVPWEVKYKNKTKPKKKERAKKGKEKGEGKK